MFGQIANRIVLTGLSGALQNKLPGQRQQIGDLDGSDVRMLEMDVVIVARMLGGSFMLQIRFEEEEIPLFLIHS